MNHISNLAVAVAVGLIALAGVAIMWGTGTGSEVMSRIAAPMVGA